jgi:hypothetical protein
MLITCDEVEQDQSLIIMFIVFINELIQTKDKSDKTTKDLERSQDI